MKKNAIYLILIAFLASFSVNAQITEQITAEHTGGLLWGNGSNDCNDPAIYEISSRTVVYYNGCNDVFRIWNGISWSNWGSSGGGGGADTFSTLSGRRITFPDAQTIDVPDSILNRVIINASTYTILEADVEAFKQYFIDASQTDVTITIPAMALTSEVNLIRIQHKGTGTITIQAGAGVTFTTLVTDTTYSIALVSDEDDVWRVSSLELEGNPSAGTLQQVLDNGNSAFSPTTFANIKLEVTDTQSEFNFNAFYGANNYVSNISSKVDENSSSVILFSGDAINDYGFIELGGVDAVKISRSSIDASKANSIKFNKPSHVNNINIPAIPRGTNVSPIEVHPTINAGTWNIVTNIPALSNANTGQAGVSYVVEGSGFFGGVSYDDDDVIENNGTVWYKKVDNNQGGGGSGIVESIVAGTNITVDSTDPANPIVSATVSAPTILTAKKTADQTISSNNLVTLDSELQVELEANSYYEAEIRLIYEADGSEDLRTQIETPSGSSGLMSVFIHNTTTPSQPITNIQNNAGNGIGSLRYSVSLITIYTGATSGTFGLKWAQNSSGSVGTILKRGSSMRLTKL